MILCLRQTRFPIVKDNFDGKKKVLFNLGFELENKLDILAFNEFKREWTKARVGISKYDYLNRCYEIRNKDYELVNFTRVPCGICCDCLKLHAQEWAVRLTLESKLHKYSWFITLTYDEDKLPKDRMLNKKHVQDFLKRLRYYYDKPIKYYVCGEYGGKTARPHYHIIIFGLELSDLKYYSTTKNGDVLYTSKFVEKIWSFGFCPIGEVNYRTASYCAQYVDKKKILTSSEKQALKDKGIVPEFSLMSLRPGIAVDFKVYFGDKLDLDSDFMIYLNGRRYPVPEYFRRQWKEKLTEEDLQEYEKHMQFVGDCSSSRVYDECEQRGISQATLQDSREREFYYKKNRRKVI